MVEEATASAAQLLREAGEFTRIVGPFEVAGVDAAVSAGRRAPAPERRDAPELQRRLRAVVGGKAERWSEF